MSNNHDVNQGDTNIQGIENAHHKPSRVTFSVKWLLLDMIGMVLLVVGYLEISNTMQVIPNTLPSWLPMALVIIGLLLMLPLGLQVLKRNFTSVKINNHPSTNQSKPVNKSAKDNT